MSRRQIEAWTAVLTTLGKRQRRVLKTIIAARGRKSTLFEIARAMKCEKNAISGRITELCRRGLIYDTGESRPDNTTGRNHTVYKVNDDAPKKLKKMLMEEK